MVTGTWTTWILMTFYHFWTAPGSWQLPPPPVQVQITVNMEATHPRTIFSRYSTKRCLHLHISFIKLQLSFTRNLSLYRRVTSPFNRSERTQTAASLKSSYKWEKSCGNHQAQSTPREQVMLLILIFPSKKNYLKF